jgi:hypothetical protein
VTQDIGQIKNIPVREILEQELINRTS